VDRHRRNIEEPWEVKNISFWAAVQYILSECTLTGAALLSSVGGFGSPKTHQAQRQTIYFCREQWKVEVSSSRTIDKLRRLGVATQRAALEHQSIAGELQAKWFNSPIRFYEGSLADIRQHLPDFERRRFALTQPDDRCSRLNNHLDVIVRRPFGEDRTYVPVGVVSTEYTLIPHAAVVNAAAEALRARKIAESAVKIQLTISEYGERLNLSLFLPEKYQFDPGDGHPMALRLECVNSVDGSTRFRALMGWFRFVCSNGLVVGITTSDMQRRHVGDLGLAGITSILAAGLAHSETEKRNFAKWKQTPIHMDRFVPWVDKTMRKEWGFKAAARTFHIARSGFDAEIVGDYRDNTPSTIPLRKTKRVPGAPHESQSLFDVSQILAWLAHERRDIQEQLEWREQIPALLKPLKGSGSVTK
jgi:hypothetical protein